MSCSACDGGILADENYLRCVIESCSKLYHHLCIGGKDSTLDEKNTWVCPECCCAAKKGGNNSSTPVGSKKRDYSSNVTHRKRTNLPTNGDSSSKCDKHADHSFEIKSKGGDNSLTPAGADRDHKVTQGNRTPMSSGAEPGSCVENAPSQLSAEVRSLRQEVFILRDQLALAISILTSYDAKLEGYSSQVQALHIKYEQAAAVPVAINPLQSKEAPREPLTVIACKPAIKLKSTVSKTPNTAAPVAPTRSGKDVNTKATRPRGGETCTGNSSEVTHSLKQGTEDLQQWTEVRRSRRPASLSGTAGPTVTTLKAVEPRSYVHLWNMESSAEEIRTYLRGLCPGGTCSVTELSAKGDYKSYKIGVPVPYEEMCLSAEVWPVNAKIKPWIVYPARYNAHKPNQPFRDGGDAQNLH